jgi:hypothetical protein
VTDDAYAAVILEPSPPSPWCAYGPAAGLVARTRRRARACVGSLPMHAGIPNRLQFQQVVVFFFSLVHDSMSPAGLSMHMHPTGFLHPRCLVILLRTPS